MGCAGTSNDVFKMRVFLFLASLKDLRSETMSDGRGTLELPRVQKSCRTGHGTSKYDRQAFTGVQKVVLRHFTLAVSSLKIKGLWLHTDFMLLEKGIQSYMFFLIFSCSPFTCFRKNSLLQHLTQAVYYLAIKASHR